ncbi:MAG TPA: alpha/beta hydrolase, partial [Propionibacteriaceae bacterium]
KGLQCASVRVPLDYGQPDATAITLSMAKKAATAEPRLGTLFIDPGGPGGSGISYVDFFPSKGLEGYDIVGWDPRGVGQSTPVNCSGANLDRITSMDVSPDDDRELAAVLEANRQFGLACLKKSGPLLQHVSTIEVARDLDLLRTLVGDDKANLFGASYGTQIGATYAELFPQRVGRFVLDGAVNITGDTSVTQVQGFERALGAFAEWCARQQCRLGDTKAVVLASISDFWRRLDSNPIQVRQRQLTQQLGLAGVQVLLYSNQRGYPLLQRALESAIKDSSGNALLALADQLSDRSPQGRYGQINYAFPAIRCLDEADRGVQGELELAAASISKAPTIGPISGPDLVCTRWPVAAVPPLKLVGAGAAPIVVIGTTGDPATPYEYAVSMAKQLRSGVLISYRGVGHTGFDQSACVQKHVLSYLNQGVVPKDGTTC